MLRYMNGGGRLHRFSLGLMFHEPNTGANATPAAAGNSNANNGGQGGQQNPETSQPAPGMWDAVNMDELDEGTRRVIEAARADHQRIATELVTVSQQRQQDAQRIQQLEQTGQQRQQQQQQNQPAAEDPGLVRVKEYLRTQGYTPEQVNAQAPVFAGMFATMFPMFRDQIGRELAPLANSVIGNENTNNFAAAMQSPHGAALMADPAVAQAVWEVVEQQTAQGKTFSPDAVLNLAKMQYVDRTVLNPNPANNTNLNPGTPPVSAFFPSLTPATPTNRSTGGGNFSFPGAHMIRPAVVGGTPTGQPAMVNADTQAALASTFAELHRTTGVAPRAFQPAANPNAARR